MPRDDLILHIKPFDMGSYLEAINDSIGSEAYRTLMWSVNGGEPRDILENGLLSCAFYVSSLLLDVGLIRAKHATVRGLVEDEFENGGLGWYAIDDPQHGDIVVWGPARQKDGQIHRHVGFYIGPATAISHSDRARTPIEHSLRFGKPPRAIEAFYTHPAFRGI